MKLFTKLASMSNKALVLSSITAAMVVGVLGFALSSTQAQNITIGGPRDCDSNAIIYCGTQSVNGLIHKYKNGDGVNRSGQIKNVFNHFGITEAQVLAMNNADTKVVAGKVTKSGNVVGPSGNVLATNAITAGRENISGSTQVTRNGTTFYTRPPSVSFLSNSLDAFIVLDKQGNFKFAILAACGNPVKANPVPKPEPKKPGYTIEKEVKVKGTQNFKKSVNVKSGQHVIYRIAVKSVGQAPVQNAMIRDNLPAHIKYVNGSLKRDGQPVAQQAAFFSNGMKIVHIAPGETKVFTFEGIVGPNDKPATCKNQRLTNVAKVTIPQLPNKDSSAVVEKDCKPPQPTVACVSLQAIKENRVSYTFRAKASATNGAKITGYKFNFGDGETTTVNSKTLVATTKHSYPNIDTEKSYTTTVTVIAKINGKTVTRTAPACKTVVKVAPKPAAECKSLKLTVAQGRKITATTEVTTKNGAKLVAIGYDFDDGNTLLVNNLNPVNHTYAEYGEYVVKANVVFNIDGKNVNSQCEAPVSFVPVTPPEPEVPTCEELAAEDPSIICEVEPIGKEVPTELANTGPGSAAAAFVAVTALGTLGYRTLLRRNLGQ